MSSTTTSLYERLGRREGIAALETHGIDPASRNEVLAILWSLKGEVVRV